MARTVRRPSALKDGRDRRPTCMRRRPGGPARRHQTVAEQSNQCGRPNADDVRLANLGSNARSAKTSATVRIPTAMARPRPIVLMRPITMPASTGAAAWIHCGGGRIQVNEIGRQTVTVVRSITVAKVDDHNRTARAHGRAFIMFETPVRRIHMADTRDASWSPTEC
jgi:hypothetical protein